MNRITPTDFPPGYIQDIEKIHSVVKAWSTNHPGEDFKVQFNYPENAMIIASIEDAVSQKAISLDAGGEKLIKEILAAVPDTTAFMLKVAFTIKDES